MLPNGSVNCNGVSKQTRFRKRSHSGTRVTEINLREKKSRVDNGDKP